MSDNTSEFSDNPSEDQYERSRMIPVIEAQYLIREIAGPMPAGSQIQGMLDAVARETRIGFARIKGFWHGSARVIRSDEMDALRAAARRKRNAREAKDRDNLQDLVAQLAAMQRRMDEITALLDGPAADEWRAVAPQAGEAGRAVAGGDRP